MEARQGPIIKCADITDDSSENCVRAMCKTGNLRSLLGNRGVSATHAIRMKPILGYELAGLLRGEADLGKVSDLSAIQDGVVELLWAA